MAHAAFINLSLKERPVFSTQISPKRQEYTISADLPASLELEVRESSDFGRILYFSVEDILSRAGNPEIEQIKEYIRQGHWTFLFDQDGNFIENSMEPV